jgi:hypothetical protein
VLIDTLAAVENHVHSSELGRATEPNSMSGSAAVDPAPATTTSIEGNVNEKETGYEVVEAPATR